MRMTLDLPFLLAVCACLHVLHASNYGQFTGFNNFERLRQSNCSKCKERLQMNVAEVLPRLALIKDKIMLALGRNVDSDTLRNDVPRTHAQKSLGLVNPPTTKPPEGRGYYKNKIISSSDTPREHEGDAVLRFRVDETIQNTKEEAVGASLRLFVDRRRKIKKGGKGKKIYLEVSKLNTDNETWTSLTYLRTRVKKQRWKIISLPVNVAQQLLDSDSRSLDLKVKCVGCGRLVQLVLRKDSPKEFKTNRRHSERRVKGRKNSGRRKLKHSASPMLVISTRYRA